MKKRHIKSSVFRAAALAVAVVFIASACGSDGVAFDGLAPGAISLYEADDIAFAEISPFATFGSAQGNFGEGAHGTFGIFGAGDASPPHTHSSDYYAVVLDGDMNNPFGTEAQPATLPTGSFWSVPANDEHITACLDPTGDCLFFFHAKAAFDFSPLDAMTQERSDGAASVPAADLRFVSLAPYDSAVTVWGDPATGPFGSIAKVDASEATGDLAYRHGFTLVPITGELSIESAGNTTDLPVGSLLEAEPNAVHQLSCDTGDDCTFYLFSDQRREMQTS